LKNKEAIKSYTHASAGAAIKSYGLNTLLSMKAVMRMTEKFAIVNVDEALE